MRLLSLRRQMSKSMRFQITLMLLTCCGGALAQSNAAPQNDGRYRLQPSDVLEVHYRYTPEFDQTVNVQPDGLVNLQIVGDLKVDGMTTAEVKAAIVEKASLRLRDPEITVVLKEFEKPYFIVAGQVANPGRFDMRGSLTAVEAVAMAGGFKNETAKHSQVILYRRVGPDLAQAELLNLKAAMSRKNTKPLASLKPGDLLVVPQSFVSKVERFVKLSFIAVYYNPSIPKVPTP